MTDSERLDWIDRLAQRSYTGISVEHLKGEGYRFMSRGKLDMFRPTLREAIDAGIRERRTEKDKDLPY